MSSKKKRETEGDINNKKAKMNNGVPDFVSDGLDTNEIRTIIMSEGEYNLRVKVFLLYVNKGTK